MKTKIKLIACDLDGTLLLDGATRCRPELFPLIEELTKRGVSFMPARKTVSEPAAAVCAGQGQDHVSV